MTTDWIQKWADYEPQKIAIREADTERQLSYTEFNQKAGSLTSGLQQLGLQKGDRVAVLAEFCVEYTLLFSVAQKMGIILVPLNYRLSAAELDYILSNAQAKIIFSDFAFLDKLKGQSEYENIEHKYLLTDIIHLAELGQNKDYQEVSIEEKDPLFILYTSGTTGFPKGAIYTHEMLFWNAINTSLRLDLNGQDHTLVCTPPFHTGGWNVLLTPLFFLGGTVTLLPQFNADRVLQIIEEDQISNYFGVPTMLKMMGESEGFEKVKFPRLRYCVTGGEAMPIPLIEKWAEKGVPIRQGYGMTEAGPNLMSLHQRDGIRKKGSIGTPNFYVETRLVDEKGVDVAQGEIGEFLIKGKIVTPGYWQNEEATEKAFYGEWFRTGDLLRQDEEGYFYVVDRIKHMYISGGENVYPVEVEQSLRTHTAIRDVAIVGVPDERWGETGMAFIVKEEVTLNENEIEIFLKERLAKYKHPKHFVFLEELPKGDTGKIDRKAIKVLANEELSPKDEV
ncbi:class I adenylate-forming enzyme family protein [Sediminitomix flava]|uniref:Fatty-acyl-CoA synthase n=1 Tax=Sediminitomix flava TaxID=379075 RepID=A0A315ZHP8_SEDFL|nr:AMP-binding protein [Sediminitomix flava]PWJ44733.1 fatty-acyl-CoA synthase [Sediminitomix flava]